MRDFMVSFAAISGTYMLIGSRDGGNKVWEVIIKIQNKA